MKIFPRISKCCNETSSFIKVKEDISSKQFRERITNSKTQLQPLPSVVRRIIELCSAALYMINTFVYILHNSVHLVNA